MPACTASAPARGLASPPPRSPPRSPLGRLPRALSEPRAGGPSLWADTGKRRESERVPVLGSRGCCLLLRSPPHLLCKHGSGLRGWAGTSVHLHGDLGDSACFGHSLPAPASLLVSAPHRDPVQSCSWGRGRWRQTLWWGRGRLVAGPDHSPGPDCLPLFLPHPYFQTVFQVRPLAAWALAAPPPGIKPRPPLTAPPLPQVGPRP